MTLSNTPLTRRRLGGWAAGALGLAGAASLPGCGGSGDGATGATLAEAGVGVANLEQAVAFYRALGMVERSRATRSDRREVVLASADARGAQLVLFSFTDGSVRNYRQNPGKIVFYVKNPASFFTSFAAAAAAAGSGGITGAPTTLAGGTVVGFGRDPGNNLVEIATPPATDAAAAQGHSYISAFGVGVSNLEAARRFYVDVLGFQVDQFLSVTRPTATGGSTPWYDEYILVSATGRGSAVVLMTYTDGVARNYTGNPVRLGLSAHDPAQLAQCISSAALPGTRVLAAAAPDTTLGGRVLAQATDADGTALEIGAAAGG